MATEIVIDDPMIQRMLLNTAFVEAFPWLTALQKTVTKACKCKKNMQRVPDYARIRKAIGECSLNDKKKFKQLFGNAPIVILYRRDDGQQIKAKW